MITAILNFFFSLSKPQKREYKKRYEHGVYSYHSYFKWNKCEKCKKEFRREAGYRLLVGPFCNNRGRWIYLCNTCCPSEEQAHDYGISGGYMPVKPIVPPSPPPPKRK